MTSNNKYLEDSFISIYWSLLKNFCALQIFNRRFWYLTKKPDKEVKILRKTRQIQTLWKKPDRRSKILSLYRKKPDRGNPVCVPRGTYLIDVVVHISTILNNWSNKQNLATSGRKENDPGIRNQRVNSNQNGSQL